jgi:hypothetical protein
VVNKIRLRREARLLSGDATFLQRLLVGWTRSSSVKLAPFSEEERTKWFAVKRYARGSTPVARQARIEGRTCAPSHRTLMRSNGIFDNEKPAC